MKRSKYSDTQIVSILKEAEAGLPVKEICRKYGISSASYYNWKSKFGGMSVSELKRNRELEAENAKLKLNLRRRPKKRVPSRDPMPLLMPQKPNPVWSADFMSDALYNGVRFRTFNVLGDFNREALKIEIEIDTSLPSRRLVRVFEQLKSERGLPDVLRTDNGPEFLGQVFTDWCDDNGIMIDYIEPGRPNQNAFIERFNRSYRNEVLDTWVFRNLDEVRELTWAWMLEYNEERDHDGLGGLTPAEALQQTKVSTFEWSS